MKRTTKQRRFRFKPSVKIPDELSLPPVEELERLSRTPRPAGPSKLDNSREARLRRLASIEGVQTADRLPPEPQVEATLNQGSSNGKFCKAD